MYGSLEQNHPRFNTSRHLEQVCDARGTYLKSSIVAFYGLEVVEWSPTP